MLIFLFKRILTYYYNLYFIFQFKEYKNQDRIFNHINTLRNISKENIYILINKKEKLNLKSISWFKGKI